MNDHERHDPAGTPQEEPLLRQAGFGPQSAGLLTTLNRWLFPFTLIVSVSALVWIGIHLWPDLDASSWQQWADDNPAFFAPLQVGDVVVIIPELHSHMGLAVTRIADGVGVERHLWFPFDNAPLGLIVRPDVAEQWLQLSYADDDFWRRWHALAAGSGVRVYQRLDPPGDSGYSDFLLALQPPQQPKP